MLRLFTFLAWLYHRSGVPVLSTPFFKKIFRMFGKALFYAGLWAQKNLYFAFRFRITQGRRGRIDTCGGRVGRADHSQRTHTRAPACAADGRNAKTCAGSGGRVERRRKAGRAAAGLCRLPIKNRISTGGRVGKVCPHRTGSAPTADWRRLYDSVPENEN